MLSKVRHYVPLNTLRMIYFGIFHSIMSYGSQIWGQFLNQSVKRISNLQNKSMRIINFAHYRAPVNMYYKQNNILKITDLVQLNNFYLFMIITIIIYQLFLIIYFHTLKTYTYTIQGVLSSNTYVFLKLILKPMALTVSNTNP